LSAYLLYCVVLCYVVVALIWYR